MRYIGFFENYTNKLKFKIFKTLTIVTLFSEKSTISTRFRKSRCWIWENVDDQINDKLKISRPVEDFHFSNKKKKDEDIYWYIILKWIIVLRIKSLIARKLFLLQSHDNAVFSAQSTFWTLRHNLKRSFQFYFIKQLRFSFSNLRTRNSRLWVYHLTFILYFSNFVFSPVTEIDYYLIWIFSGIKIW